MTLLKKQLKADFKPLFLDCIKGALIIPLFALLFGGSDMYKDGGMSYIIILLCFALPLGYFCYGVTNATALFKTSISFGSTRKTIVTSALITMTCTLIVTNLIAAFLGCVAGNLLNTPQIPAALAMAFQPALMLFIFSLSMLAVTFGLLAGFLVARYGRWIFAVMMIVGCIGGGGLGGLVGAGVLKNEGMNSLIASDMLFPISLIVLALAAVVATVSFIFAKKAYIS